MYLDKLNIDKECYFNTKPKEKWYDIRRKFRNWKFAREHKFYERETWGMDTTLATWLYEHFCAYRDSAGKIIDLEWHKIEIDGETHNQKEWIDIFITELEDYLVLENDGYINYDVLLKKEQAMFSRIGKLMPYMWW